MYCMHCHKSNFRTSTGKNFCIQYPYDTFFVALESSLIHQEPKSGDFGGQYLKIQQFFRTSSPTHFWITQQTSMNIFSRRQKKLHLKLYTSTFLNSLSVRLSSSKQLLIIEKPWYGIQKITSQTLHMNISEQSASYDLPTHKQMKRNQMRLSTRYWFLQICFTQRITTVP